MHNLLPEDKLNKWLAILRSNKWRRGEGRMLNEVENSYCPLGLYIIANYGMKSLENLERFHTNMDFILTKKRKAVFS